MVGILKLYNGNLLFKQKSKLPPLPEIRDFALLYLQPVDPTSAQPLAGSAIAGGTRLKTGILAAASPPPGWTGHEVIVQGGPLLSRI